jgi:FKBP-type peptidyl-prolyl cis-trans isomerase (trigger factor)
MDETSSTSSRGNKNLTAILVVVAILLLAGGAYWYLTERQGDEMAATDEENQVAAVVNGHEIDRATLERSIEQVTGTYAAQGIDTSSDEANATIREQALTALINRQLMIDAATAAGLTATEEEIQAEYQVALDNVGGEESLATALSDIGMTEADLRADIANDVIINRYLDEKLKLNTVTVSDEEVKTAYDEAAESNGEDVPPLEDVEELIRNQLLVEKQQELIGTELERLRGEATIEIMA